MTTTMCQSGSVLIKAGENVDANVTIPSTFLGGDQTTYGVDEWINQAEAYINNITRTDFTAAFSGLNANKKLTLEEACSNLAAIYAIQYNMAGYTSRIEAEDMINVLWARFKDLIEVISDQNTVTWVNKA